MFVSTLMKRSRSGARARGHSLVEFFMVSALVGVVSAFALPRYTRLGNEARATQVLALSALVRRVAEDAHSQYVASGGSLAVANSEGKAVALKNGYPDASANGIRAVIVDRTDFVVTSSLDSVVFMKQGAALPEQCAVTYSVAEPAVTSESVSAVALEGC